jgi:hypothetical protein
MNTTLVTICIPRIDISLSKDYILNTFSKMNIGKVQNINEHLVRNDNLHKRVILNITLNLNNQCGKYIYDRLTNEQNVKIVYDMPWYWICYRFTQQLPSRK